MSTNYFFGRDAAEMVGGNPRYFYGLRRTDNGELFLAKVTKRHLQTVYKSTPQATLQVTILTLMSDKIFTKVEMFIII